MAISRPNGEPAGNDPARDAAPGDVTRWLHEWTKGDRQALEQLIPLVYAELRRLARGYLSRRAPHHSLQPTALINEAFVRRIDHTRKHGAAKRGGSAVTMSFDETIGVAGGRESWTWFLSMMR